MFVKLATTAFKVPGAEAKAAHEVIVELAVKVGAG